MGIAILKLAVAGIVAPGPAPLRRRPAPGLRRRISETIDWARAVLLLGGSGLDRALVKDTLGLLLKHQGDRSDVEPKIEKLLAAAEQAAGVGQ